MTAPRTSRYARDVAVVAFAQSDHLRRTDELSEVEMVMPVLHEVLAATGSRPARSASPVPAPATTSRAAPSPSP